MLLRTNGTHDDMKKREMVECPYCEKEMKMNKSIFNEQLDSRICFDCHEEMKDQFHD